MNNIILYFFCYYLISYFIYFLFYYKFFITFPRVMHPVPTHINMYIVEAQTCSLGLSGCYPVTFPPVPTYINMYIVEAQTCCVGLQGCSPLTFPPVPTHILHLHHRNNTLCFSHTHICSGGGGIVMPEQLWIEVKEGTQYCRVPRRARQ